jgi:putative FmdB family regulatory protein
MPIYEYHCSKCGKTFELIQRFSDAPLELHENCGGALEKLISTSALQFKGSGWYINDYAKGGAKKDGEAKSDTKTDTATESKTESKTETKTESKTESKSDSTPAPVATKSE